MKVFVLFGTDHDNKDNLIGIFSTEEKAISKRDSLKNSRHYWTFQIEEEIVE